MVKKILLFIAVVVIALLLWPAPKQDSKGALEKGVALHQEGKYEQALEQFNLVLEQNPLDAMTTALAAYSLARLNTDNERAMTLAQKAQAISREAEVQAAANLAKAEAMSNADDCQNVIFYLNKFKELHVAGGTWDKEMEAEYDRLSARCGG